MAAAKISARKGVDFDLLGDIEADDVLQLHFLPDSIGDVAYLLSMINAGIITVPRPDMNNLEMIQMLGEWGDGRSRYVTFSPTKTFDRNWFEGRMDRRIDKLEVKLRRRSLVDASVLDQPDVSVRYRFKPDGVEGVVDMLDLHDMGVLELGAADNLREALAAGQWTDDDPDRGRVGHFTSRLAGGDSQEYREHFIANVIPHLEFLRC